MRGPGPKSRGNLRCYLTPYYYSCSTCWTTSSPSLPAPAQSGILQSFSPDLVKLVRSRSLDSLPASLFKDVFQSIGPCVLAIISTASGKVLLKKKKPSSTLLFLAVTDGSQSWCLSLRKARGQAALSSFRQTAFVSCFSRTFVELILLKQLVAESAVTFSCIILHEKGFILLVLDLTLVFDTADRHMLLDRLKYWVGVSGSALDGLNDAHLRCLQVQVILHFSQPSCASGFCTGPLMVSNRSTSCIELL